MNKRNVAVARGIILGLSLLGAGCTTQQQTSLPLAPTSEPSAPLPPPANNAAAIQTPPSSPAQSANTYVDSTTGLRFTLPIGWTTTHATNGNLVAFQASPYSAVIFQVVADKTTLQNDLTFAEGPSSGSTVVKKTAITVAGFPATQLDMKSSSKTTAGLTYTDIFVDGGTKWLKIAANPSNSKDVTKILQSLSL